MSDDGIARSLRLLHRYDQLARKDAALRMARNAPPPEPEPADQDEESEWPTTF